LTVPLPPRDHRWNGGSPPGAPFRAKGKFGAAMLQALRGNQGKSDA
jgi:hypothetical protein